MTPEFWKDRRVLVTGHTGFKGAWLVLLLRELGAQVTGVALPAESEAGIFSAAGVEALLDSHLCDIRHADELTEIIHAASPEIVLHMAAQPLVRESYREPVQTFQTNVIGTVNVLEALRTVDALSTVLVVTTDKVYRNPEDGQAFRESDPLGGLDPYSASKSCTELVVDAWRYSFFGAGHRAQPVSIATARAGNVIGGGDASAERLLPDVLEAFEQGRKVELRQPNSIRPWQHVLEPLSGYIALIEHMHTSAERQNGNVLMSAETELAYNFGPATAGHCTVEEVVSLAASAWGKSADYTVNTQTAGQYHEAGLLRLDCSLATRMLGWRPTWSVSEAVSRVVAWRRAQLAGNCMQQWSLDEIRAFRQASSLQSNGDIA